MSNLTLEQLKTAEVIGNAYSDHHLLSGSWDLATEYASNNQPDLSFEALDIMGQRVMGEAPMTWEEFVDCLTYAHREVW